MTTSVENFVENFHTLQGITVGERRRNFFALLHQNASLKNNNEVLDAITRNLKPQTYLESLFKLEYLIYFRRAHELLELLKEGNDVFVSKIIKEKWVFQTLFDSLEAEELVNNVLPSMSFCVRMKVLRKLSQYVESPKFDKIFDVVIARYGVFTARGFITGCTTDKIKAFLKEYPMSLSEFQLKLLYKKDPELIEFYIINYENFGTKYHYQNFLRFLYNDNLILYNYLKEKYEFELPFGKRMTKKFVSVRKNDVIGSPNNFNYLVMPVVIRKLGKESVQLFCNSLRTVNIKECHNLTTLDILSHFPKKYHYGLIFNVLQNHYNIKIVNYPEFINHKLLKLVKDNQERARLAKAKVNDGDDDYIKYLTLEESIPLLKEKINLTADINERRNLIGELIETCYINNKDIASLTQVIKYFVGRHKNDDFHVHMKFISKIEQLFGFSVFNEEMWNYVNELLTIHVLKYRNDLQTYQKFQTLPLLKMVFDVSQNQKFSYLNYLFKNNQPIDDLITEVFKTDKVFPTWGTYDKDFEKYFLMYVVNNASGKFLDSDKTLFNSDLINELTLWNKQYPEDQISFYDFPFLMDTFNYIVRNYNKCKNPTVVAELRKKIFTKTENNDKEEFLKIYWPNFQYYGSFKDFDWFMKYEPLVILRDFDLFMGIVSSRNDEKLQIDVWRRVKKFSHLKLDEKSKNFCISKISDEHCLDYKPNLVICLSALMKPADFVAFADLYKPTSKSLNLTDEKEVRMYNLQCAIAKNFKFTNSYEVLPSLLNYCMGDYFKFSLPSLYSIMYRTPENLLPQHLKYIAGKAVSVRKHALYLTCQLSTFKQVEKIIKLLNKTEGVQSLQKYLFSSTIKYFVRNPSDQFFELVKSNMLLITKEDKESHDLILKKCRQMPLKYKGLYIQYSWEFFEKIMDVQEKLLDLKRRLLIQMENQGVIEQLSLEFAVNIIDNHFFEYEESIWKKVVSFVYSFLFYRPEKDIILAVVLQAFNEGEDKQVYEIFDVWYGKIMKAKGNYSFLQLFLEYFEERINPVEDFSKFVKMFFLKMKMDLLENYTSEDLAERIFVFLERLHTSYGPYVITLFAKELKTNFSFFLQSKKITLYTVFQSLITKHPLNYVAVTILEIMVSPKPENFTIYLEILRQIKNIPDNGVQIILHSKYTKDLKSKLFSEDEEMDTD